MFRFLHSSDLHLGKPFGGFDDDARGRLRAAREDVFGRLAQAARDGGAGVVLLAGDTFDQETPTPRILRHARNAMAQNADITWVLMPGNHDSLAATVLWSTLAQDRPDNLILATDPSPIALGAATVLPAPCTVRSPGRDLTETMDQPTPEGQIRVGLGHGGITDFAALGQAAPEGPRGVIAPDRAARAGLDYLGLGDWHGQIRIDARSWYSGTPEPDSFKHDVQGQALLVEIAAPGAAPRVAPVATGALHWHASLLSLTPGEDVPALIETMLPPRDRRHGTLLRLRAEGRLSVGERRALARALDASSPDFLSADVDLDGLTTLHSDADIEALDPTGGALRQAAQSLGAQAVDPDLSRGDREEARHALDLLHALAAEVAP
ncbi:DNA repair exonuclease [Sulfitobacter albidus]|uniref:DNA repair exonuclease n=1 Tax=Sulfitobacter albidus TaxID=2829501 RepID=A0A975JEZ6_9RHOB|nr:DNA repair exonuclease [Sulfitobacter albidus]QUJ77228.1 DNA repair exonuclease [Sulfitobacter albidus]